MSPPAKRPSSPTYLKEKVTDLFLKLPWYPIYSQAEQNEYDEYFAIVKVNITPICERNFGR